MSIKLLKIGEFAKLCQTTKDTILHYEKKGLLKACFIDSNNYRYYSISQYLIFDRIKLLQDAGYSLNDIKNTNSYEHSYSDYIKNTLSKVQEQANKLKLKENMLKTILNLINEIELCRFDKLEFKNLSSTPILSYTLKQDHSIETMEDCIKLYKNIVDVVLTSKNHEQLILGMEFNNSGLAATNVTKVLCSIDAVNTQPFELDAIDESLYAIYYHIDDFKGHCNCIYNLKQKLINMGYSIQRVYMIDIYSVFSNDLTEKSYKAKYLFKIKK